MKLGRAIEEVRGAEERLSRTLRQAGERHAVERDLYHLSRTLARQSSDHLDQLAVLAEGYGVGHGGPIAFSESGLLLRDLCDLYVTAREAEIAWVVLAQGAAAARDRDLLELARRCHEHAEIRGKWLETRIKETAPQVAATG
jgi:hypothetical protein